MKQREKKISSYLAARGHSRGGDDWRHGQRRRQDRARHGHPLEAPDGAGEGANIDAAAGGVTAAAAETPPHV